MRHHCSGTATLAETAVRVVENMNCTQAAVRRYKVCPDSQTVSGRRGRIARVYGIALSLFCCLAPPLFGAQLDIQGPPGSANFGTHVTVLPNKNIVVTDPFAEGGGAVHLYSPSGALISTLVGDQVGSHGVVVVGGSNFVVVSPDWNNRAGAVTWVNGATGLSGIVSPANSLVGSSEFDQVGRPGPVLKSGITVLTNGNYVVVTFNWRNGAMTGAGAVTWCNGATGRSGAVSSSNSLVGSAFNDFVGYNGATALTNGNYVVRSSLWNTAAAPEVGAVTWGDGNVGVTGVVSPANSLVGNRPIDRVGFSDIGVLTNGNYVVVSPSWDSASVADAGAVTWANGATGRVGTVSESNSLIGVSAEDQVGLPGVTSLANGNYVVRSRWWNSGGVSDAGAVTWANGATGLVGVVNSGNSLVGTLADDRVGDDLFIHERRLTGVTPLANGNYVVASPVWDNGAAVDIGAITWSSGVSGRTGALSPVNSMIGGTAGDKVGASGVWALANNHYVVASPSWSSGGVSRRGAVTWGNGNEAAVGIVVAGNSLVGSQANDSVGILGVTALTNGNYVVVSPFFNNGLIADVGAATWLDGSLGISSVVSSANSLVGSSESDLVGRTAVVALANGHYVVQSPDWKSGTICCVGAITWGNGNTGLTGAVSATNSLVGSSDGDRLGESLDGVGGVAALSGGNYTLVSRLWDNGSIFDAGAVALARGDVGLVGTINASNSVLGTWQFGGLNLVFGYDATLAQMAVGRRQSNIVSLFSLTASEVIFANSFE